MVNEKEFRARVKEIERRIPEAFAEDPCYFFESDEECVFFKEHIQNKVIPKTEVKGRYSGEVLSEINRIRKAVGLKPMKNA